VPVSRNEASPAQTHQTGSPRTSGRWRFRHQQCGAGSETVADVLRGAKPGGVARIECRRHRDVVSRRREVEVLLGGNPGHLHFGSILLSYTRDWMVVPARRPERTNKTRTGGLAAVVWMGTLVLAPAFVAALLLVWTDWTAALLEWALTHLAELVLPGYAEWKAQ